MMNKTIIETKDVGEFFRAAREKRTPRMGMKALAKKAGVTEQTIINIEFNRGNPNLLTLLSVATALGIKIVLNLEDPQNPTIKELH